MQQPLASDPTAEDARPRAMHDIGGVSTFLCTPVDTAEHALSPFDRRVDAIRNILGQKRIMSVDELRRGIEALPEESYFGLTYYQRWLRSILGNLLAKGVISEDELAAALAKTTDRTA